MANELKKRRRPRKNGVTKPEFLLRSISIIHAYQKARAIGGKHSAAVRDAIDFVRQLLPGMPISETAVRRTLSAFQPQHNPVSLRVDYSVLEGEEAVKIRSCNAQMLELMGTKNLTEMGDQDQRRPLHRFTLGIDKRPNYPRHNGKNANP